VQLKSTVGTAMTVGLEARVNNPSCHKVQLTKLELNVLRGSSTFATISTTDKVKVARRSNEFQPVSLEVRLRNVLGAIMLMQQKNLSIDDFMLEGEVVVKAFPLSKKISIEKMSVREFTAQYGDIITPLLELRK